MNFLMNYYFFLCSVMAHYWVPSAATAEAAFQERSAAFQERAAAVTDVFEINEE
jgi:hypothetical protein